MTTVVARIDSVLDQVTGLLRQVATYLEHVITAAKSRPLVTGVWPELMTYDVAEQYTSCSKQSLRRQVDSGRLLAVYVGADPRFRRADLDRWMQGLPATQGEPEALTRRRRRQTR